MTESKADATYTMGRSAGETERLIEQAHLYERVTLRMLRNAGVEPGMKVLDIGSGAGDVAMAAAQLVGPEGAVVGVDMNPEILETARARAQQAGHANIEFLAGDALELELPRDFDAVIGRLVLMYLADPVAALKQFVSHLRSGGIVAFQEGELTLYQAVRSPDTPLINQLVEWGLEVFQRSGANIGMGLELQRVFTEAGLPAPVAHLEAPAGAGPDWGRLRVSAAGLHQPAAADRVLRHRHCRGGRRGDPGGAAAAGVRILRPADRAAAPRHRLRQAPDLSPREPCAAMGLLGRLPGARLRRGAPTSRHRCRTPRSRCSRWSSRRVTPAPP